MGRIPLGRLLVREGHIDEVQLKSAISHRDRWGGRIGESLVALGYLSEKAVLAALARQLGVAYMEIGDRRVPSAVLRLVPEAIIRRNHVFPVAVMSHHLHHGPLVLAVADPADLAGLDEVAFASGMDLRPVLVSRSDLDRAVDRHFEGLEDRLPKAIDLPPDPGPMHLVGGARG
jgi:Type II secretion system (T2SS), protein E, N-terminal domain